MGRYVANTGEKRTADKILIGKPGKNDHLEDPCIDGRISEHYKKWCEFVDGIHLAQNRNQ
jgi:hypothetical protein